MFKLIRKDGLDKTAIGEYENLPMAFSALCDVTLAVCSWPNICTFDYDSSTLSTCIYRLRRHSRPPKNSNIPTVERVFVCMYSVERS
jgi:hypothetical protein